MELSRRQFMGAAAGTAAAATVGGTLASTALGADPVPPFVDTNDKIFDPARMSIQLFTVRDAISRLDDPTGIRGGVRGVFETLAAQGYKEVEFAGYTQGANGPITIQQIKELLDANGLKATGSHVSANAFTNPTTRTTEFERAAILGMDFIGTAGAPSGGSTLAAWQTAADLWNQSGLIAQQQYGLKGIYEHPERPTYQFFTDPGLTDTHRIFKFLELTDPSCVFLEMDIFWAYVGAAAFPYADGTTFDPATWVHDNRARFRMFHFKNGNPQTATITRVEDGLIDYVDFFTRARGIMSDPAIKWVVEQDNAGGGAADPGRSLVNAGTAFNFVTSRPYPDVKGSRTLGPATDTLSSTVAEAYESTAEYGGEIDHINAYVERRTTAGWLAAGIYSDNGGHPGTLLSQGNRGSLTKPGWNTVSIPPVTVERGQKYWIAVQGLGGILKIRTFSGGAGVSNSETGDTRGRDDLPATWTTDTVYPNDGPLSAFAPLLTA
jgi:sugar phosphate isomerase/epimerase